MYGSVAPRLVVIAGRSEVRLNGLDLVRITLYSFTI